MKRTNSGKTEIERSKKNIAEGGGGQKEKTIQIKIYKDRRNKEGRILPDVIN